MADKFNNLIGAVAEHNIFTGEPKLCRDGIAQRPSAAIGIKVRAIKRLVHCRQSKGRGAKRVFV